MSKYVENLIKKVIDNSVSNNWNDAVREWDIVDCEEDESLTESCICGKEELRYLYTIQNRYTNKTLFPIGSSCIKKFNRDELNEVIKEKEEMYMLYRAIRNNDYIELNSDYFSRRVLKVLLKDGAFDNEYNGYNGTIDYEFMLDMFNKRNKENITHAQKRKINAIIINAIKPYLRDNLKVR